MAQKLLQNKHKNSYSNSILITHVNSYLNLALKFKLKVHLFFFYSFLFKFFKAMCFSFNLVCMICLFYYSNIFSFPNLKHVQSWAAMGKFATKRMAPIIFPFLNKLLVALICICILITILSFKYLLFFLAH